MKNKRFWISLLALILIGSLVLSLLLMVLPTKASARSSSEIKDQIAQMEKENKELEQQIKDLIAKVGEFV